MSPHPHVLYYFQGSTTALGSLFQSLTTLSVKIFFLILNLKLPWHGLRMFPQQRAASSSIFCTFYLLPQWSPHPYNNPALFCLAMQYLIRSQLKVAWLQSELCYLVLHCKQNHTQYISFLRGFSRELCGTCNCPHKQIIN